MISALPLKKILMKIKLEPMEECKRMKKKVMKYSTL